MPAGLGWSVTAVSAGTLTLAKDTAREEELKALSASWEAAAPGRAVKAKESRDKYLSDIAPPPPPEEWTNADQALLDKALAEVPRDLPKKDRWQRIAAQVPGRSARQCAERYKFIRSKL